MRQLRRASDLTREHLKDNEYRKLYEQVAREASIQFANPLISTPEPSKVFKKGAKRYKDAVSEKPLKAKL